LITRGAAQSVEEKSTFEWKVQCKYIKEKKIGKRESIRADWGPALPEGPNNSKREAKRLLLRREALEGGEKESNERLLGGNWNYGNLSAPRKESS